MENLDKLIYKNPEHHNGIKNEATPEQLEYSIEVAQEKLKIISDPDFYDYAVRYMNIEEYKKMMETGEMRGGVSLNMPHYGEFLPEFIRSAPFNIQSRTDWIVSGRSVGYMSYMMNIIRDAKKRKEEPAKFYDEVKSELLKLINKESYHNPLEQLNKIDEILVQEQKLSFISADELKHIKDEFLKEVFVAAREKGGIGAAHIARHDYRDTVAQRLNLNSEQADLLGSFLHAYLNEKHVGDENLRVIRDFQQHPENYKDLNALRPVMIAYAFASDGRFEKEDLGQYHIAVIFDAKAFGFKPGSDWADEKKWANFSSIKDGMSEKEKKRGILAAVSLMELKDISQEMIKIEKGSGDAAHPFFDHKNRLRWPQGV